MQKKDERAQSNEQLQLINKFLRDEDGIFNIHSTLFFEFIFLIECSAIYQNKSCLSQIFNWHSNSTRLISLLDFFKLLKNLHIYPVISIQKI